MPLSPLVEPFTAEPRPRESDGRRVGVLLSHGFTSNPASVRAWAESLAERGYAVELPLLPGHGTTWQDLNETTFADWYGAIERSFDRLAAENDAVVAGGLSMGQWLSLPMIVAGGALMLWAYARARKAQPTLLDRLK